MTQKHIYSDLFCRKGHAVQVRNDRLVDLVICGLDGDPLEPPRDQKLVSANLAVNCYLHGGGTMRDANGEQRFGAGWVVLRLPGMEQRVEHASEPRFAKMYCCVPVPLADALIELGAFSQQRTCWRCADLDRAVQLFRSLHKDLHGNSRLRGCALWARLLEWFHCLNQRPRLDEDPLERAAEILAGDMQGQRDIEALARQIGIPYNTFRRHFRQRFGQAPAAWRMQARMRQACSLLLEHSVQSVASRLGYPNPFAFSAQFSRSMKQSPRAFQQMSRS